MAYVVTEAYIKCKYRDCVEALPLPDEKSGE
jgi:hypothetical protein